jgi:GT2 family glycosyltransferase
MTVGLQDVHNAYLLFLGREPESEQARHGRIGLSPAELFHALTAAPEFRQGVVEVIAATRCTPPNRFQGSPSAQLKAWLSLYTCPNESQDAIASAATWPALLKAVFLDDAFVALVPEVEPLVRSPAFIEALDEWSTIAVYEDVVGEIEVAEQTGIRGWAVNRTNPDMPVDLQAFCNGVFIGACRTEKFRRDIQARFQGAGRYGFSIDLRLRARPEDSRPLIVDVRELHTEQKFASALLERRGEWLVDRFFDLSAKLESIAQDLTNLRTRLPDMLSRASFPLADYNSYRRASPPLSLTDVNVEPLTRFLLIIDMSDANEAALKSTLRSLADQTYDEWRAVFCCEQKFSLDNLHSELFSNLADRRITYLNSSDPKSEALARILAQMSDGYVLRLTAGDVLETNALHIVAREAVRGEATVIVVDEDVYESGHGESRRYAGPMLKAAFDPVWMLQADAVGAAVFIAAAHLRRVCEQRPELLGDGPTMRFWCCMSADECDISHLPLVLLHRLKCLYSDPVFDRANATKSLLSEQGIDADTLTGDVNDRSSPLRIAPAPVTGLKASVIIPTHNKLDMIKPCIEKLLLTRTKNRVHFDVHIVDNRCTDPAVLHFLDRIAATDGVSVVRDPRPFNWSAINNAAARGCDADILIFLNDDTAPLALDWCDELCFWASQPSVGAVGARLLYEDGSIQHAGVVGGPFESVVHEGVGDAGDDPGYLDRHRVVRRAFAVTGACLATPRSIFEAAGGFDEEALSVTFSDIDYCLKVKARGHNIIYTPHATFHHFESKSRGFDFEGTSAEQQMRKNEHAIFMSRWGDQVAADPTYNARFERWARPFTRLRTSVLV